MGQSTRFRRRLRQAGVSRLVLIPGGIWRLGADPPPTLSREARVRLAYLDWHAAHGCSVARTCRRFGISRSTFYRWQRRYDPGHPERLENRSCRPLRRRHATWTWREAEAVRELRERYPRRGRDKLAVLLRRQGIRLSVSMVGRILTRLRRSGELREPRLRRISARRRARGRPYAVRLRADHAVERPGDLVELDTLDVRPPGFERPYKQFTARDRVSRWDVLELARSATAAHACEALEAVLARMPFGVRAVSVDNGSEFMADFEAACQARGIALLTLKPRSPKLHGTVERANRTHTEEFYEVTDAEPGFESLRAGLADWEHVYNTVRPHQALGYLTPAEFLGRWRIEHPGPEV